MCMCVCMCVFIYTCISIYLSVYYTLKLCWFYHHLDFSIEPDENIFLKYILPANIILNNCIESDADLGCKCVIENALFLMVWMWESRSYKDLIQLIFIIYLKSFRFQA